MVGVQTQFGAERSHLTAGSHQKGPTASAAEFELALSAGEVHATAPGQCELEAALRAGDPILGQMFGQSFRLVVRVVG